MFQVDKIASVPRILSELVALVLFLSTCILDYIDSITSSLVVIFFLLISLPDFYRVV